MSPLTIILITHNRLEYTKRTIESLKRTVPHARLCVWVNGTDQVLKDYVHSVVRDEDVIECDENIGWGKAVNEAMSPMCFDPKTEYVLLSNNDVEYYDGWYEKCLALYEKYTKIGVLGVWRHTAHGVRQDLGDMMIKDDMPAVGWLMKRSVMNDIGPVAEHGPCPTKGGNGEDSNYTQRAIEKGYWVCGPNPDVANHLDGY